MTSDGSAVLCECGDSVGVVSLASGKVTGSIKCEEDQVTCIALAPDDSSVVVALKSTSVQQYKWPSKFISKEKEKTNKYNDLKYTKLTCLISH